MEPQITQPQEEQMSIDDAKASLGIATRLSEQFFNPKQEAQPEENTEKKGKKSLREEYPEDEDAKLDTVLDEIKSIKEELAQLTTEEDEDTE